MRTEDLLRRLHDVRPSGSGHVARCPAHEDREPSLSVSEGEDGRILLYCHAGCSTEAVVEALGLRLADLMPETTGDGRFGREPAPPRVAARTRRETARYVYTDEEGRPLYQVRRYEPKTFRQYRCEGGEWKAGLGEVRRVLYRLPEVLEAARAGLDVCVVEGEKDADRLSALDFVATTCAMGAGKWRPEYSESLRGARVVILPDNDEPGRLHAAEVARSLWGVARSICIVNLPGLSAKDDVSDWLDAGGTAEDLRRIIRETPPLEAPPVAASEASRSPQEARPPEVLPDVRHLLPPPLRAVLDNLRTDGERAAFLTAALAVASAALGRVSLLYGGREHTPALMAMIVGAAGAGKGGATLAARLLDDIDERLRQESEEARATWESRRREASETGEDPPPEPPMQYVVASESTSEAALTRALADNPDGLLLFSSEADSLTAALRQEWGAFSHLLRKAFHHEPHRRETRSAGLIVCERVVLSLALAGTPAQLERLIEGGVENGLYSRFVVATIHDAPRWVSQRPRPEDELLRAALEALRGRITEVWEALRRRDAPLRLDLTPAMWDRLDAAFADLHGRVVEAAARGQAPDALAAVVKRAALSTVRIAATLTCIEAPARGVHLDRADRIEAAPEAFEAALTLGLSYARQTLALASRALRETLEADDVIRRALAVLETLPPTFETKDYEAAAGGAGVTDRTARRWLERLEAEGLLHSPRRGVYERHERPAAL